MPDDREHPAAAPPPLVALAGWILPGAGYWIIGQRTRVVQAPDMTSQGNLFQRVLTRPWFIGQVLTGPVGIGAAFVSDQLAQSAAYGKIEAKARLAEIGTLYTAVAGMLNLLTIIDASHRAASQGARR